MSDGSKNTTHENAIGWLILAGVGFALLWLIWYVFSVEIMDAVRWLRISEAKLIAMFVSESFTVNVDGQDIPFKASLRDAERIPAESLDGGLLAIISKVALEPIRFIVAAILLVMGFWALLAGPGTQYRRKMNIDGLIAAQSQTFPAITPFIKFNPSNQPPRPPGTPVPAELPLFAEALGPEEWVAYNSVMGADGHLNEDTTYIAFAKQLGPRWQGPMKLPPYKQILLAAFCLKAARKRADSDSMLGRIAGCWSPDKGLELRKDPKLLKEARAVLRNRDIAGETLAKCNQHAFHTTALLRALLNARDEGGVLAPAQFVWLRGYDRVLWYPLNNLGRQAFHMESLGAMAHFKAERMTRRPVPKPKIDNAVKSISEYISSPRSRPIPHLDYSKSKKKGIKQPKAGVKKPKQKKKAA